MLSSGTRIGTTRILNWLGEGSCGQSYHCLGSEGEIKGKEFYIKLIPREISERKGFQDYFLQEVQTLEQLDGPGIWPVQSSGVTKWKHWIRYPWLGGMETEVIAEGNESNDEGKTTEICLIQNLENLCEYEPHEISSDHLLSIMACLHQGIYKAHLSGVCHGNLKPSNILVKKNVQGEWEGFVTEFGLYRLNLFTPFGLSEEERKEVSVTNMDSRASYLIGEGFRPNGVDHLEMPEEKWDLFALGKIAQWVMEQTRGKSSTAIHWTEWEEWVSRAIGLEGRESFETCAHSMDALPQIGDISRFGIKVELNSEDSQVDLEELRLKRELKFKLNERVSTLRTKRGITGLVGGVSFFFYILYSCYLFLAPSPWTEYSLEGLLDSYQLGAGVFTGQAWGIVPGNYDEDGDGGQDVVGEWSKEDGLFKLKFKRFKKSREQASGKKLWQFIGEGKTSVEDYFIWDDFLKYDRHRDALLLVKRKDSKHTYIPGVVGSEAPRLYPEERIKSSLGKIQKSELLFIKDEKDNVRWSMFFAIGFLLASWMYHRELKKMNTSNGDKIECR
jgi:serine/threonine protein kinase